MRGEETRDGNGKSASRDRLVLEERLFHEARQLAPGEWPGYLATASGGDTRVVAAVMALLTADARTTNEVDRPVARWVEEPPGVLASRYRVQEAIGEGGWGTVYRAEQDEPVRREVAVKILKAGLDTRAVVARFRAEQQALALMEHEGIARVFDAGETERGRPYFVMELVRGKRVTEFCDEERMTVRARLELFVRLCEAVQHAHQKGVIHRDLKPSNILVVADGGRAVSKVIDFGIAKATQGRLGKETVATEVDVFMGTPAYMSPEQAEGRSHDVDTRTDVYGLGAVLYQLLTGETVFAALDHQSLGWQDVRRRIREEEPMLPSARLRAMESRQRARVAEARRTTPAALVRVLDGDLDSVVMRSLEKTPARRYESASGLAQDIGRYLSEEPVNARRAGRRYVWGKFVRRHRVAFAVAAVIMMLLVAGGTVATVLLFREKAALERAVLAEREQARARQAAEAAGGKARTEATRSAEVARFMTSMLQGVGPAVARGRDTVLLREILDATAKRLDHDLKDQPEIEADLRAVLGNVLLSLREPGAAEAMHRRELALREQRLGGNHLKVAESLIHVGQALNFHNLAEDAEKLYWRARGNRALLAWARGIRAAGAPGARRGGGRRICGPVALCDARERPDLGGRRAES